MSDFTVDKYESGKYDVLTCSGHSVRLLCMNKEGGDPIVGLVQGCYGGCDEQVYTFDVHGVCAVDSSMDLCLVRKDKFPESGTQYYYVNDCLMLCRGVWNNKSDDRGRFVAHNFFYDESFADKMRWRMFELLKE